MASKEARKRAIERASRLASKGPAWIRRAKDGGDLRQPNERNKSMPVTSVESGLREALERMRDGMIEALSDHGTYADLKERVADLADDEQARAALAQSVPPHPSEEERS